MKNGHRYEGLTPDLERLAHGLREVKHRERPSMPGVWPPTWTLLVLGLLAVAAALAWGVS